MSTASGQVLRKGGTTRVEFDSGWWLGGIQYNRAIKFTYNLYPSSSPPFESGASPLRRFVSHSSRKSEGARGSAAKSIIRDFPSSLCRPSFFFPPSLFLLLFIPSFVERIFWWKEERTFGIGPASSRERVALRLQGWKEKAGKKRPTAECTQERMAAISFLSFLSSFRIL